MTDLSDPVSPSSPCPISEGPASPCLWFLPTVPPLRISLPFSLSVLVSPCLCTSFPVSPLLAPSLLSDPPLATLVLTLQAEAGRVELELSMTKLRAEEASLRDSLSKLSALNESLAQDKLGLNHLVAQVR